MKPNWLKIKLPKGEEFTKLSAIVRKEGLNTICSSGKCPNIADCWSRGTATFMILGNICTRACGFCAVNSGKPLQIDTNEPIKLAQTIQLIGIKHAVITSVTRDDLKDYGASAWKNTILKVKEINPSTTLETLIPDFSGNRNLIDIVIDAKPDVISHNLETVKSLTPIIRTKATYKTSLKVLEHIAKSGKIAKTGIMLGLGETESEILATIDDAFNSGCSIFTMGQYLRPSKNNIEVKTFIRPEKFEEYRIIGLNKGFKHVESSPLVRTSYHAEKHLGY